jgi:hypothetical protein
MSNSIASTRRHWKVRILAYIDDLFTLHPDPQYFAVATLQIATHWQSLGWTIKRKKSGLTPFRDIVSELLWRSRNIIWNTTFDFESRLSMAILTTDAAGAGWGAHILLADQSGTSHCSTTT